MNKKSVIYIILIICYVSLFSFQLNQRPFERYPGWDYFWGDVLQAGKLIAFNHSVSSFELPSINPYVNFGWNNLGNTSSSLLFLFPFNFLTLLFPPDIVIMIRTAIFLMLGGIGAYLYLNLLTKDKFLSFFGGLSYISIPIVVSMFYFSPVLAPFYLIPFFLLLIHKILEQYTIKKVILFIALSIFTISSGDVFTLIILPSVVGLYSFLIAYGYYKRGLFISLKKASLLVFLVCLSCSFYIIPLYKNLQSISIAETSLLEAGLSLPTRSIGVRGFLSFFYNQGFQSLYKPIEGSALLLYIPVFFYFAIIISLILKRIVFRKDPKQALIPFTLILLGLMMFLISILFYSLPDLSKSGKGVLRYHINLFPFINVLAGFICFSAIIKLSKSKKKIIFATTILCSFAVDFFLFVVPHHFPDYHLFNVRHALYYGFLHSSNLVPIRFMKDMWLFLPLLNLFFVVFLIFYAFNNESLKVKKRIPVVFIVCSMFLPLLNISVHNELRLQQHTWQISYRNPYRWESYLERKSYIDSIIDRNDSNYRTLYVGKNIRGTSGRNWKLIAETELNIQDREKALFSYRETMHPYTGLLYSPLSGYGHFRTSNLMPPLSNKVAANIEAIKLMGVKYIISADERIESPYLIYRGKCLTEDSSGAVIHGSDGGTMYIYELLEPFGIAFLVDHYKKASLTQSLKTIHENRNHPWINNEIYLEEDPKSNGKQNRNNLKILSNLTESKVSIEKETFNKTQLNVSTPKEKYMVLSYIYRPNWKASIGSANLKIYRAYGGFMCIKVPPGDNTVIFKYTPRDLYFGLFLTLFTFLIPFSPLLFGFLKQKIYKRMKVLK